jgi:outer membrane lipoprotein carrier protein
LTGGRAIVLHDQADRGPWLALAVLVSNAAMQAAPSDPALEFARALQKKYDTIRDFSADFSHTYTWRAAETTDRTGPDDGQKPGRMRWRHDTRQEDSCQMEPNSTRILPADRQVIVSAVPRDGQTTPALFLAGQGDLVRDFTVSDAPPPQGALAGMRALKLVPRTPQPDFETLTLTVDPTTLALRGLESVDTQGGVSSCVLTNVKENLGLSDREFTFAMPRGVDVVTEDSTTPRPRNSSGG